MILLKKFEKVSLDLNQAFDVLETEWQADIAAAVAASENIGLTAHIEDTSAAHVATAVTVADSGGLLTATTVEGALAEVATSVATLAGHLKTYASGDYGANWGGTVPLPGTPGAWDMILLKNTNGTGGGTRLYIHNGSAWVYVAMSAVA